MVDECEGHCREEQEWPLRERSAGDKDLAAVADRAFDFAVFNLLDSDRLSFTGNYNARYNRFGFAVRLRWICSLGDGLAFWSIFFGILRKGVEPQIDNAMSAGKSLDHLVEFYRFSQGGRRGQKKNDQRRGEHAIGTLTIRECFLKVLGRS